MIKFYCFITILALSNLVNCKLCEKSLDHLLESKSKRFLNDNSTARWTELNSLLSNDLNRCSVIAFDDEFKYENKLIKFNISFCTINYQSNQQGNQNISIDFCLPSTCTTSDLNSIDGHYFKKLLNQINNYQNESIDYFRLHDYVKAMQDEDAIKCTQDGQPNLKFKLDFILFNCFLLILIIFIIICTTIDCLSKSSLGKIESEIIVVEEEPNYQSQEQSCKKLDFKSNKSIKSQLSLQKLIDTFSILNSINRLTFIDKDVTINCIYGFKVLSMIWIIIGHTYIYSSSIADNYIEFKHLIKSQFISRIILNCSFAVDTFFALSGFLLTYLLFRRNAVKSTFFECNNLLTFYFNRYWRLTPVYAFVLWFYTSCLNNLGSGPFWFLFEAKNCESNWWHNLLYFNNFDKFSEECMSHTWYLGNDMQFFILSPILLFALSRNSKLSYCIICSIVLISAIVTFAISFLNRLIEINGFLDLNDDHNYINLIYQQPYCRIGAYLVGLLTGYLINQNETIKCIKSIYLLIGDTICYLLLISIVFIYSNNWSYIECSFYFSLSRIIWSICVCWLIISCYLKPTKLLNQILSFKIFVVLSRLSYVTYLIHPIMLTFYFSTRTESITVYHSSILIYALTITIYSFLIAFLINLIVEIPFSNMNFLKKNKQ